MARNPWKLFRIFLKDLFDLHEGKEEEEKTIADITKGVEFRGTNLWILIFAILIASIGLDVNSTAVIIGAMLISPLMGPIMGIGLGAGINDLPLVRKSLFNLAIAVSISVITSALYFLVTPLHEAQSELLARTYPTLWDVVIAFFGGLAGIVAGSRKEKSNAIPGVAIATALMPPLCTAGYALANGNWLFLAGAFYLFSINSVFITVATFLIVRLLNYPKKQFEDFSAERRVKNFIAFCALITIIPSIIMAYNLVTKTIFEQNSKQFVSKFFDYEQTQVIRQEADAESQTIEVTLYGEPIGENEINRINSELEKNGLNGATLIVQQGYIPKDTMSDETFVRIEQDIKVGIIEEMYEKNNEIIKGKEEQISFLENEILKYKSKELPVEDISRELKAQYNTVTEFSITNSVIYEMDSIKPDTVCLAYVKFSRRPKNSERKKIEDWLKVRTKTNSLKLLVY